MTPSMDPYFVALCAIGIVGSVAGLLGILVSASPRARMLWSPLIPGGPLAVLLLSFAGAAALPPDLELDQEQTSSGIALEPVTHVQAFTDKGRPVKLTQATQARDEASYVAGQALRLEQLGLTDRVTLLSAGWRNCNCHGWVFSGGRFFIDAAEVYAILHDNAYSRTASPRASDVAVYRDEDGRIVHTGIVRFAGLDHVQVESKWGMGGLYLHPHDVHPYGVATCAFYRAQRGGHVLQGVREGHGH